MRYYDTFMREVAHLFVPTGCGWIVIPRHRQHTRLYRQHTRLYRQHTRLYRQHTRLYRQHTRLYIALLQTAHSTANT